MMNKTQKAEYLFGAIGEIDDFLVNEALRYRPSKKRKLWIPILAACLGAMLIFTFSASVAVGSLAGIIFDSAGNSPQEPEMPPRYDSLDALFEAQREDESFVRYPTAEALSDFDGACIIWQYGEEGDYYVKPITSYELTTVQYRMGSGEDVGNDSPTLTCQVWICDGKGNLRSPYLKNTAGNQDSEVFDYEVEIIPDEAFVDCISDILND